MIKPVVIVGALIALIVLAASGQAQGTGGAYFSTRHGDPSAGVLRDPTLPRGNCNQCHSQHMPTGSSFPFGLFTSNDNNLCYACHSLSGALNIYQGEVTYGSSKHSTSSSSVWPGPTPPGRPSTDWGKCVNCHDPHGYKDGTGLIEGMAFSREEKLCLACHDGSGPAATDIATEMAKSYRHPAATYTGRHRAAEDGAPGSFSVTNRHSECSDCHNPHYAKADPFAPSAPNASERIKGVGRVKVTNGAAWTVPTYSYAGPSDGSLPNAEYQLCFKCHSSWTTLPAGKGNMALFFNPNNPSYHPVEAPGKNTDIDPRTLTGGMTAATIIYCSTCHRGNSTTIKGPHGSTYAGLVYKNYTTADQAPASTDFCFDCHAYAQYATRSERTNSTYTHFREGPGTGDQNFHYVHASGGAATTCKTCHNNIHGSNNYHLVSFSSVVDPGGTYTHTANGGSCTLRCHGKSHSSRSYNWK